MRKLAVIAAGWPVWICAAAMLWLIGYFVTVNPLVKSGLMLTVLVMAAIMTGYCCRQQIHHRASVSSILLPLSSHQGPVMLVCGNLCDALFAEQAVRNTPQGGYLRAGDVGQLTTLVRQLQHQSPSITGQLTILYSCALDLHDDEAVLRASLQELRHQLKQIADLTGFHPLVVLSGYFAGPATPWLVVRGNKPLVSAEDQRMCSLDEWQQSPERVTVMPLLIQAFQLMRHIFLNELEQAKSIDPAVHPFAITLRGGAPLHDMHSVWQQWLYRHTGLLLPLVTPSQDRLALFPDAVLPLLAPYTSPVAGARNARRVVGFLCLCAAVSLVCSVNNNGDLIRKIGGDLQRWSAIPMAHAGPKAAALNTLKQDIQLIERWQRQGEPLRYGLGLYLGSRLWLSLQQAIDTYIPPASPPVAVVKPTSQPKIVRLDSLSLFSPGNAALKAGSTNVLINALVGIKAKPGWLIVVAGHTDNTGNLTLNQSLSLQRAAAVRNWMRDTGGMPESCFAVQGYGESRPVAPNNTPEGRAQNRRVEISLVPQVDACHIPDLTPLLSDDSSRSNN